MAAISWRSKPRIPPKLLVLPLNEHLLQRYDSHISAAAFSDNTLQPAPDVESDLTDLSESDQSEAKAPVKKRRKVRV